MNAKKTARGGRILEGKLLKRLGGCGNRFAMIDVLCLHGIQERRLGKEGREGLRTLRKVFALAILASDKSSNDVCDHANRVCNIANAVCDVC